VGSIGLPGEATFIDILLTDYPLAKRNLSSIVVGYWDI
jgi:hypothetical protein